MKTGIIYMVVVIVAAIGAGVAWYFYSNEITAEFKGNFSINRVWVEKPLTACGEEWHDDLGSIDSQDDLSDVLEFYRHKGLTVFSVEYDPDGTENEYCEACSCLSGEVLSLEVSSYDVDSFLDKGFIKRK